MLGLEARLRDERVRVRVMGAWAHVGEQYILCV